MDRSTSLNGGATQALRPASVEALKALEGGALPASQFNAGVRDRLTRTPNPLAEFTKGPNPFRTTQKTSPEVSYLRLSAHGAAELARLRAAPTVSIDAPKRLDEEGRPYGVVVTVTGASDEQFAQADDIVVSFARTLRDATVRGRYLVWDAPPENSPRKPGTDPQRRAVGVKAARLAKSLRALLGAVGVGR